MNYEKTKQLSGLILRHNGLETAIVQVERFFRHPRYLKFISRSKKYKAHDDKNKYKAGDRVIIRESRPISGDKRWQIIGKI